MRALLILLLLCGASFGGESEQVERLAKKLPGAITNHRLWDGTRVDILTDEYAIEVDWAWKWAEGIGQCLYYAEVTQRKPALILLCDKADNAPASIRNGCYRAQTICAKYDIMLFIEIYDSRELDDEESD